MSDPSNELQRRRKLRGLPPIQVGEPRLTYDPHTQTLILSCFVETSVGKLPQVYVRKLTSKKYASISSILEKRGHPPPSNAYHAITSWVLDHSTLYCLLDAVPHRVAAGAAVPMSSQGIASVDLDSHRYELWAAPVMVQELLGVGPGTGNLHGVVGFAGTDPGKIRYWVARLSWSKRTIEQIAPLDDVLF